MQAMAESCYRNAADGHGSAEAYLLLGRMLLSRDDLAEARRAYESATRLAPGNARAWCGLGVVYRRMAEMPAARTAYERALTIEADFPEALNNLGEWFLVQGDAPAALDCFDRVLRRDPGFYETISNRVGALFECGRLEEAEQAARTAILRYPDKAPLHVNLGNILLHSGKGRQAVLAYREALKHDSTSLEAHLNLATLLGDTGHLVEAIAFVRHQIALHGETAQLMGALALAQMSKREFSAAEQTCVRALALAPGNISALITLAGCLSLRADHVSAIARHEQAIAINPKMPAIHSNILFDLTYLPGVTREAVFERHLEWARFFEVPLQARRYRHPEDDDPARPLKIGYVSGDFGSHPVGFLIRDVLRHHDPENVEVHCYSMVLRPDEMTTLIRESARVMHDDVLTSDDELAERIFNDQIDILVDLSGHTAHNRLPVFAMKPAPLQATWIGYFHSTGLSAIDYFITDPGTTPIGGGQLFSETAVYLPHSRFCYSPPDYAPEVSPPPLIRHGSITFASFNRIEKLVAPVITAWAQIVTKVPGSRLLIKAAALEDEGIAADLRRRFSAAGMQDEQLILRGASAHLLMLEEYGDVDIALDPFPFNGGMTTLEALWMGIPVVALAGESVVSRQSASALTNIGACELIFADLAAYTAGAVALAHDAPRLSKLRREMRAKMSASPLCQAEQFTRDLEMLYRRMWAAHCRHERLDATIVPSLPVLSKTVLHVGCGRADRRSLPALFQNRWQEIRLDIDPEVMPDVIASMLDMSAVADASVDAVYSSHNLEHLHPHEVPLALREFRRVLKDDGVLVLTCPDLQSVCALVAEDKLEEPAYLSPAGPIAPIDMLYGLGSALAQGNLFMAHNSGFTAKSLARHLADSNFASSVVTKGTNYDLWALAYRVTPSPERLAAERKACLP